ncbi:MAG: arylsulfatase, partial [Planctomycetota bacterium]
KDRGGLRDQFHHVNDIAPTILDILGIDQPKKFNGIEQKPMEGTSFAYTFADDAAKAKARKTTQYFELFGNRGVYHDGWMAATFHKAPWDMGKTFPFDNDKWELFNLEEDFTQATDLSRQNPEKLKELQDLFLVEAKKYDVLPLDDRGSSRFDVKLRPSFMSGRDHFVFYPGATRLAEGVAPDFKGRSHTITADVVIPNDGAEGVLLAMGGGTSGFVLYVKDDKLVYDYDWFSYERYSVRSEAAIPTGKVRLSVDFQYDGKTPGKGGSVILFVNGKKAGEGRVERTVPFRYGMDSMDVGMDLQAPVSKNYRPPFKFTGTIDNVTIELKE